MRKYIRHPSSIPVRIRQIEPVNDRDSALVNVGYGGLAMHFPTDIESGTEVELLIDLVDPAVVMTGTVVWSEQQADGYLLGVQFKNDADVFQMRMVEQVCHIEHYRQELELKEGRKLSSEQAAAEWIEKFAGDFPGINS